MPIEDQSIGKDRFFIMSNTPGRIRYKIPRLYRNNGLASQLRSYFSKQEGIYQVKINPLSKSLLVFYDLKRFSPEKLNEELNTILSHSESRKEEEMLKEKVFAATASTAEDDLNLPHAPPHTYGRLDWRDLWHQRSLVEIQTLFQTDLQHGLSKGQAERMLARVGLNQFDEKKPPSIFSILLEQLNEFLPKLLLGASAVSALLGQYGDAITIASIVLVESALGVWQHIKAEKSLDTLHRYTQTTCRVIRNGTVQQIHSIELVPGDLVSLKPGDLVPADLRLIATSNLRVNEAPLTGESEPNEKSHKINYTTTVPLAERKNMLYMGTTVVRGTAKGVVVQTGMTTEMGQIANLIQETEPEPTPLQKDLNRLAKSLTLGCLGVSAGIMALSILRGQPLLEVLRSGVSLAIGTVPEGLTAVLAVALAFGVQRMAKKGAIVKNLPVVESLSCADIICTDKTGTLTKGEMTVQQIYTTSGLFTVSGEGYSTQGEIRYAETEDGRWIGNVDSSHPELKRLIQTGILCNNSTYHHKTNKTFNIVGDPTEGALWILAAKGNFRLEEDFACYTREKEIAFDSETKQMVTVCRDEKGHYSVHVKGAPDVILRGCTHIQDGNTVRPLTLKDRKQILQNTEKMADQALRVMGFAYREQDRSSESEVELGENLIFIGLTGMMDPPRLEVRAAIEKCQHAGIRVIMITGDHQSTATAIGKQVGLLSPEDLIITGDELDQMNDDELVQHVDQIGIYARTSPHQKLRIVQALQKKGHIVAMTGDGVNDAPAIKAADIGIAMGQSGTDITREASSIILTDDNFATIVKAIEEGRTISGNIKKFIRFILAGNIGQVLAIGVSALLGLPTPLLPGQILMVDLATEGVTSLSLGVDPPDEQCMSQPPRDAKKSIFDRKILGQITSRGLLMGITTMGMYLASLFITGNLTVARTMAYANLIISQLFHVFDCRTAPLTKNKLVIPSVVSAGLLLLSSIYIPLFARTLGNCPISLSHWGIILLVSGVISRLDHWRAKAQELIIRRSGNSSIFPAVIKA